MCCLMYSISLSLSYSISSLSLTSRGGPSGDGEALADFDDLGRALGSSESTESYSLCASTLDADCLLDLRGVGSCSKEDWDLDLDLYDSLAF